MSNNKKRTYNCSSCNKKFTSCTAFEKCPFCKEDIKQSKNLLKPMSKNKMIKNTNIETKMEQ